MSSAAQRSEVPEAGAYLPTNTESSQALKQVAAERLAAHRHRRAAERAVTSGAETQAQARAESARSENRRGAALVREAVAARYQQTQSYREFLAAEAERALQQAQAEAEIAARNAQAIAEANQQLLADLDQWEQPRPFEMSEEDRTEIRGELAHQLADIALGARELINEPPLLSVVESSKTAPGPQGITVRLYEDLAPARADRISSSLARTEPVAPEELEELEQEIQFRHAPDFVPHVVETQAIPANIIEFPRQLIAPRRARPRLAEGPLLEESAPQPQLRIFEVEAAQIATEPERSAESNGAPGWQSLLLEAAVPTAQSAPVETQSLYTLRPQAAPVHQRLMSAAVDGLCLLAGVLVFGAVAAEIAGPRLLALKLPVLAGSAVGTLAVFFLLYQALFFTLSDATPGMRYARIALCTFGDDNPTRKAMRRRTFATILAACPLGIGLAWMWMDDERLGWHDRISRMYQRAY